MPSGQMPCIRCSECAQVCPARLLPQDLLAGARNQNIGILETQGLEACIECGCCDYVCPSAIPITAELAEAKTLLARARFEEKRATAAIANQARHNTRHESESVQRDAELRAQTTAIEQASDESDPVAAAISRARARRRAAD
jgi:electron transport complex protein RnfC